MRKSFGEAFPKNTGTPAWIRIDDGFSVRACRLVELSAKGVRIVVNAPHDVADRFLLLMSRGESPGRRCRVKERNGTEIEAEFVGAKG